MPAGEDVFEPRALTRDMFSATIGSIACCYTGQPMDTIKVRMQTNPAQYPGVASTTFSIFQNEGIAAFWKGAVPTAMGMAAENIMAFGVNEALKRAFPDDPTKNKDGRPDMLKPFLMGTVTGCCSATVLLPSEIVKAKTQVVEGKNSISSNEIARRLIRQNGLSSLAVGLDGQLMRDGCFYAVFFGSYELFCYWFRTDPYLSTLPEELQYFLSGGFAGMAGWTFAMPFDVPKTNIQARYDTKIVGSYFPELAKIAQQRGFWGLYQGLGPTLIRAFPANAALFLGVETAKKFFDGFIWRP